MIVNAFTTTYLILAAIALALAVAGSGVGYLIGRRWRASQPSEEQYELEKRVYLVIALVTIALSMRIVLAPAWFWALGSLVAEIPGAMCLTGVHLLKPALAFTASALKLVVPILYGYWLVLNAVDRQLEDQPFTKRKLLLLLPLAAVLLLESYCDIGFLTSIEPRKVSCCTSIFDQPGQPVLEGLTHTTPLYTILFGIAATVSLVGLVARLRGVPGLLTATAGGIAALTCFVLALHVHLSPLLLHAPFHHCVFCVWQELPWPRAGSLLTVGGLSMGVIYGLAALQSTAWRTLESSAVVDRVRVVGAVALAAGLLVLGGCIYRALTTL